MPFTWYTCIRLHPTRTCQGLCLDSFRLRGKLGNTWQHRLASCFIRMWVKQGPCLIMFGPVRSAPNTMQQQAPSGTIRLRYVLKWGTWLPHMHPYVHLLYFSIFFQFIFTFAITCFLRRGALAPSALDNFRLCLDKAASNTNRRRDASDIF